MALSSEKIMIGEVTMEVPWLQAQKRAVPSAVYTRMNKEQFTMIQALRLACVASTAAYAIFTSANAQETSVDITILADQIRSQGFACSNPTSAELIAAESVPDGPVYLLKCESAVYQIRLIPDQAAKVTRIE